MTKDEQIALLRRSLLRAREYVDTTHKVVAAAAGHQNVVLPDLQMVDYALNATKEQDGHDSN